MSDETLSATGVPRALISADEIRSIAKEEGIRIDRDTGGSIEAMSLTREQVVTILRTLESIPDDNGRPKR